MEQRVMHYSSHGNKYVSVYATVLRLCSAVDSCSSFLLSLPFD